MGENEELSVTEVTGCCARVRQKCNKFPMKNEFNLLFCVFGSIFLESRADEVQRDVTIEDEIRPVNLLCSSKVTYPTDHSYA
jgi:hypothetical protein